MKVVVDHNVLEEDIKGMEDPRGLVATTIATIPEEVGIRTSQRMA